MSYLMHTTRIRLAVAVRCLEDSVTLKGRPPAERRAVGWGEAGGGRAHGCGCRAFELTPIAQNSNFVGRKPRGNSAERSAAKPEAAAPSSARIARIVQNSKGSFVYIGA